MELTLKSFHISRGELDDLDKEEYPDLSVEKEEGVLAIWLGANFYENGRDGMHIVVDRFSSDRQSYSIYHSGATVRAQYLLDMEATKKIARFYSLNTQTDLRV